MRKLRLGDSDEMTYGFRARIWTQVIWLPEPKFLAHLPGSIRLKLKELFALTLVLFL